MPNQKKKVGVGGISGLWGANILKMDLNTIIIVSF